jgi:GPH family glycoside/pentoside/hexuronide:cation symporter
MFASIYWWVVKLGMALALALGGFLLDWTGFDVDLNGEQTAQAILLMRLFDALIPVVSSGLAIWAVYSFPITEEKAHEIRLELEARRGEPAVEN